MRYLVMCFIHIQYMTKIGLQFIIHCLFYHKK
jgi:hypothetical protein